MSTEEIKCYKISCHSKTHILKIGMLTSMIPYLFFRVSVYLWLRYFYLNLFPELYIQLYLLAPLTGYDIMIASLSDKHVGD